VRIEGLRFAYPGEPALIDGWSATLAPGVTQVYGDTGSGKTTLLRLLAGELEADGGRLELAGVVLSQAPERYRSQVFYVDPSTTSFHEMTGHACLAALGADPQATEALVQGFGLGPHVEKPLYMLSTGSRRKVWLAAALTTRRPLVLLDDPAGALDGPSTRCLWAAVADIARQRDRMLVIAGSEPLQAAPLGAVVRLPLRG